MKEVTSKFKIQNSKLLSKLSTLLKTVLIVLTASSAGAAQQRSFHNGLSLQGYTGILNTPSAHVTDEGWLYALYSNQVEDKWRQKVRFQDNYLVSVGLFNFIEVGGRFFEAPGAGRDISANVKVTSAPLTRDYPLLPVIAAGAQDPSGGAVLLKTSYLVISEDIWRLRLSAGYGKGPDRMKGFFAGGEFKAHDWLYLLGEYDTRETNVGVRVVLPQFWKVPISFTATAKTSLDYKPGNFDVAVGMSLPLDFRVKNSRAARHTESVPLSRPETASAAGSLQEPPVSPSPAAATSTPLPAVRSAVDGNASSADLASLRDLFVQAGFINVRIGTASPGTVVVEYENVRFNHNELDAMGVATGIVARHAPGQFDSVRLVLKRHDISMVHITMPLRAAVGFLNGDMTKDAFNDTLMVSFETTANDTAFLPGTGNTGFLKSSLLLYPGLTTFVGTEYGVFDYLLSLKPELLVNAWKGAVLDARWDIPVSWSDNLDDGKAYRNSRHPAQLERLMLFQAFKPSSAVMANLGGGMILHDIYGTLNEAVWSPGNGAHSVRVTQAYGKDVRSHETTEVYLGSYRYYFSPLDLSLEGTGGKFWAQDRGFSLELKRFFADTAVSLYYKNTKGNDDKKWQAVGLQLSFPLTFGKDMKHYYMAQVRGSDEWSYAQETTLKNNNVNSPRASLNYLAPYPLAINPQPTTALYRAYYNRDRLSETYIRKNLDRLRDAWDRYGNSL